MSAADFDLGWLLQSLTSEEFFARHWEREPLLLQRGKPDFYDSLVRLTDLEAFISRGDARHPAVRLARGGAFYPPAAFTHDLKYGDEVFREALDLERVHAEYSSGATIVLPAWHRSWPALGRLCAQLETQLDHPAHANAYLTPARAAGFTPHYDTHEVFILQIAGRKRWRVYLPPLPLPHRSQPFAPEDYVAPAVPTLEVDLTPGDLLYLPRGYVHTTTTAEQPSTHLTIGVTVYTWIEVLTEFLQSTVAAPELRQGLPPGFAWRAAVRAELPQRLAHLLQRHCEGVDTDAILERFINRVVAARPRRPQHFLAHHHAIGRETQLSRVRAVHYLTAREQDDLILVLNGRRIRLQPAVESTLAAMCRLESFTPQTLPGDISLEARISLARFLYGLGFLQTADRGDCL